MADVESWDPAAAGNNSSPPDGFPEGQTPASLNDCSREVMAAVARMIAAFPWLNFGLGETLVRDSDTQFTYTGVDLTASYTVGRRLQEVGATTVYGTVLTSSFSGGNTVVTVTNDAAAAIPGTLTAVKAAVEDANSLGNATQTTDILGRNTVELAASALTAATTNGCSAFTVTEISAGTPELHTLDFSGSVDQFALFAFEFPKKWDLLTLTAKFKYTVSAAVGTTMRFGLQAVAVADAGTIATAYGTAQHITDTFHGAANVQAVTAETAAITVAGTPAFGKQVYFRVVRDQGSDTTTQLGRLQGVTIYYVANALNDA